MSDGVLNQVGEELDQQVAVADGGDTGIAVEGGIGVIVAGAGATALPVAATVGVMAAAGSEVAAAVASEVAPKLPISPVAAGASIVSVASSCGTRLSGWMT